MRRSIIIAAAALAVSCWAGAASASELLIANIMPTTTVWSIDGKVFMTVEPRQHGIKDFVGGPRSVTMRDADGRSVTKQVAFPFASRETNGAPELLVLSQATCEKYLSNQPPTE